MGKDLLKAGPVRVNEWGKIPNSITNIGKINKGNSGTTMPDLETSSLMQPIDKPEIEIEILLMRTNHDKRICPGLKARLAGIATFAQDEE